MIDLHTHLLPGVDDGSKSLAESIAIIERSINEGVTTIVITPHIRRTPEWDRMTEMAESFASLYSECQSRDFNIELELAAEVLLTPIVPNMIEKHSQVIINGACNRYVLVELPFSQLPLYTDEVLFQIRLQGIIPILAHPERYLYLSRQLKKLEKWIDNGVKLQCNTGSLIGNYGWFIKRFARKLLKKGYIDFFGSDTHSISGKHFPIKDALRVARKYSKDFKEGNPFTDN